MPALGLHPQLERHAAQHEAHEHCRHRQVQRAEDLAVRHGERDEEEPDTEDEPRLVRIPEGRDRADHQLLLLASGGGHQHADAEVVAVEQHVEQDREAHQRREDEHEVHQLPLRDMCVSVTMYARSSAA